MNNVRLFLILSIVTFTLSFMTEERYNELVENAPFQTISYATFLSIFRNKDMKKDIEIGQKIHEEELEFVNKHKKESNFLNTEIFANLPSSFDWRTLYPQCFSDRVRDQEECGGCWAFASTASFGERLCIKNKGSFNINFSPQYLISCDYGNMGCNGGNRYKAWSFLITNGVVSEYCVPFTANYGVVERCMNRCTKYPDLSFSLLRARSDRSIRVYSDQIQEIKLDLMNNGPITAGMITYDDMYLYQGDLYYPGPTAVESDRHAVNIVGWGIHATGVEYWIVQNSWGPTWGEKGYFKIAMNLLDISKMVITGDV